MGCAASNSRRLGPFLNPTDSSKCYFSPMQVHKSRSRCVYYLYYIYPTVPLHPNAPADGNWGWTNPRPPYAFCDYTSPPPPYTEVAPYGHTTLALFSPLKMDDSLSVSIGAGSSYSGGGGSVLDATTVSIGGVLETRANSPIGCSLPPRVVGGDLVVHNPHPSLRTGLMENEETSSAPRRSRSVGSAVAVQNLSPQPLTALNPRLPRQARTRHPSLPPFAASPFIRRASMEERQLQAMQRGDFPVAESLQSHPQPSSLEDEMHSLSLEADSLRTLPPASFEDEMRTQSQVAEFFQPRPSPSLENEMPQESLQLRPSISIEDEMHYQSQDAESFQPRSFPSPESEMHPPPSSADSFQPRPSPLSEDEEMHLLSTGQFIAASQVAPQHAVMVSEAVQIHRKKRHRNRSNHKHVTSSASSSTITSTAEVS